MDIRVATFAFFVSTVKSLEQFPYTVSYGRRRYNRCIQCGKTALGALEGLGKEPGRKGRSNTGWEGTFFLLGIGWALLLPGWPEVE